MSKSKKRIKRGIKLDPTRTALLRKQFAGELSRRFDTVKRNMVALIAGENALGLTVNYDPDEPRIAKGSEGAGRWVSPTSTPAFKEWFGDSKVVDENGKPLVVYHGSPKQFSKFEVDNKAGVGIWFAVNPAATKKYHGIGEGANVFPVYLNISNPVPRDTYIAAFKRFDAIQDKEKRVEAVVNYLSELGYDGIRDRVVGSETWAVFKPSQIRSAITGITLNTRWSDLPDNEKLEQFKGWIQNQIDKHILSKQAGEDWIKNYVARGYYKGTSRSYDDVRRAKKTFRHLDVYQAGKEEFIQGSLTSKVAQHRIDLLTFKAKNEFSGDTAIMAKNATAVLAEGMASGKSPREVGRDLAKVIDKSKAYGVITARTLTIAGHADGQLDALEAMGVTHVGVAVEWSTAEDEKVCPKCAVLDHIILTIKEARGLIPRHRSCRCAWIPANLGENDKDQIRTEDRIRQRIAMSLRAGRAKKKQRVKSVTGWQGGNRRLSKKRPKSTVLGKGE